MSLFGNNNTTSTSASLFGNNNNNNGSSLFGANNQNQNNNTSSLFGNNNNNNTTSLFGQNNKNTGSLFGQNNNANNNTNSLFGQNNNNTNNNTSSLFGQNNNNTNNNTSSLFGQNNNTTNNNTSSLFGQNNNNTNNNTSSLFGQNNNNSNNNTSSLFGQNNNNNGITTGSLFAPKSGNNQTGNLSGINNNNQSNNSNPNIPYIDLNNSKIQHDLLEYQTVLVNIDKCINPTKNENMFKDYLYNPIEKGKQPNEYNVYNPYTKDIQKRILYINDYNIWEEGNKNNKNPNEYYTVQISSVDDLLNRNKKLETAIFKHISETVDTQKNLEILNKKIDDEMNNKLMELKNCHLKLDELELNLSSKVAQYNYLIGTAKENVRATQEIKDTIKKTNDTIKKNNMIELCDKIKKSSNENFGGESYNYIKDMNKDKINNMLDALVEIQSMMTIINNNNKKNLDKLNGMQREVERILSKNTI